MSDVEGLLERAEKYLAGEDGGIYPGANYRLIRDLASHIKSDGWQDIEGLIKVNGMMADVWVKWKKHSKRFSNAVWSERENEWIFGAYAQSHFADNPIVTHYRELPSPPVDNKEPNND